MSKPFDCMILLESGSIASIKGDRLYPDTKIIWSCDVLEESIPYENVCSKIMEIAKEMFSYRKDDEDKFEFYECRSAYRHCDIWIISSWLPDDRQVYKRLYYIMKNVETNPICKKCDW